MMATTIINSIKVKPFCFFIAAIPIALASVRSIAKVSGVAKKSPGKPGLLKHR